MLWGDKILPRGWIGLSVHWAVGKRGIRVAVKVTKARPGWHVRGVGVGVRPLALWHTRTTSIIRQRISAPSHPNHGQTALHKHTWHTERLGRCQSVLTLISSLVSVGFLFLPSVTTFLRNSLFSPAHFLSNSRESLLFE